VELAKSGSAASTAVASSVSSVRSGLEDYVEGLYLLNPLTSRPLPKDDMLGSIDSVSRSLAARVRVFRELGNTYAAFAGLGSYDAEAEVRSSLNDLTTAVNGYAQTIGAKPPVSNVAGALAERGFGFLARWYQSRLIKRSSEEIRSRLLAILALLEEETAHYQDIAEAEGIVRGETAKAIWNRGLACPHPIIRQQVANVGLEYDPEALVAAGVNVCDSSDLEWNKAVTLVLTRRADRRIAAERGIIASNAATLRSLVVAHKQLEERKPITLEGLRQQTQSLRELLEELARLRALDAETE
jgi:hypothetical protein